MKQMLILSGKGGTGKTTIAASFIHMSQCRSFADCDVDAPNLHLVVHGMKKSASSDYTFLGKAEIDSSKCTLCGICETNCRFEAIKKGKVDPFECEGCGVCREICPEKAIQLVVHPAGSLFLYRKRKIVFSTASLAVGSGTTGKLVAAVKKQLSDNSEKDTFTIIDGAPGIGCPVMASMGGVDGILIVIEPSLSGFHDMKRLVELVVFMKIRCAVCINRFDINRLLTEKIEAYCAAHNLPVLGEIPYDQTVLRAVNTGKTIDQYPRSPAGKAVHLLWQKVIEQYGSETGQ